ncbi:uncharacterized protein LOC129589297 [Paramacrobiotus metropolitanus]|uniref:uncharacterized protein LOC129589297 n=1 Tax=Paramacrobiotus metropolitanus TaxID=2943436 RepID=UPI002445A655|nr:uncharacterized protein LOC129589297 [Paramacrobiotus metropolitanus]
MGTETCQTVMERPAYCKDLFGAKKCRESVQKWLKEQTERELLGSREKMISRWGFDPISGCPVARTSGTTEGTLSTWDVIEVTRIAGLYAPLLRESRETTQPPQCTLRDDDDEVIEIVGASIPVKVGDLPLPKPVVKKAPKQGTLADFLRSRRSALKMEGIGKRKSVDGDDDFPRSRRVSRPATEMKKKALQ